MCPHTAIYVSSYCYILLYMCPHTATYCHQGVTDQAARNGSGSTSVDSLSVHIGAVVQLCGLEGVEIEYNGRCE